MSSPLSIQYLGQEGFRFTDGQKTLVIDPYLSYSVDRIDPSYWTRNYAPPVQPTELRDVDLVLCSHDHLDHADPESLTAIAHASPRCRFGGPRATVKIFSDIGIAPARIIELDTRTPFDWEGVTIESIPAAHETYEVDGDGHHRFVGFLLRWNGITLYHAGDTVATPELSERLEREQIDIGFLPVNGADEARRKRNVVGNMDVAAAATFAAEHDFGLLVPMHYDLYSHNGLSDVQFAAEWAARPEAQEVPLKVFRPGEIFSVEPPRR